MGANPGFWPHEDGYVQQGVVDYYEAIAKGGVGLLVTGAGEPDWPIGTVPGLGYRLGDDKYIPSLARLAEAIKRHDCPAFIQVFHMGPMHPQVVSSHQPVAASSFAEGESPMPHFAVARELTVARDSGDGREVGRRRRAGQQGRLRRHELNAGCNHLLNSFLSRAWNRRRDDYGCDSLDNRARTVVELIQRVKQTCSADFGLIALLNGAEPGLADGLTLAESIEFARRFEAAGADAIHVRAEFYRPRTAVESTHFPDMALYPAAPFPVGAEVDARHHGAGGWVPMAAAIKKAVSVPVIAVGRLDPDRAEDLLRRGVIDSVNLNRRLMADHELPNKLAQGRSEDIAPCTACMTCFDATEHGQFPRCRINAALAREHEYEIVPAAMKKRVMVVGGGPAGMEAAREGERVTLDADTIVTALPLLPNTELLTALAAAAPEVYSIGDSEEPRLIVDVVAAGAAHRAGVLAVRSTASVDLSEYSGADHATEKPASDQHPSSISSSGSSTRNRAAAEPSTTTTPVSTNPRANVACWPA